MGDCQKCDLRVNFDRPVRLTFVGSQGTSDACLLAYRELHSSFENENKLLICFSRRQCRLADWASLNTMVRLAFLKPLPFVRRCPAFGRGSHDDEQALLLVALVFSRRTETYPVLAAARPRADRSPS